VYGYSGGGVVQSYFTEVHLRGVWSGYANWSLKRIRYKLRVNEDGETDE